MSILTKNHKVGLFAIFIASALMLGTISVSGIDSAFAGKDKDKHESKEKDKNDYEGKANYNKRSNNNGASQVIDQSQFSSQSSECANLGTGQASAVVSALNCNNIGAQLNLNTGNNAIGQQ